MSLNPLNSMTRKDNGIGLTASKDEISKTEYSTNIGKNSFNFYDMSRAYTVAYALCYIFSPFMGLHLTTIPSTVNAVMLIGVGLGLLGCVATGNKYLILVFAGGEAFFCAAHFLKILPWVPLFSDSAYLIMSVLDLIQATFLFMQYQVIND
jgi:hypothetical protein